MDKKFSRTEMLIGNEGMEKLNDAKVAIFGLGGVGSFVCEGLARSGVGNFVLIDFDKIDKSNINSSVTPTGRGFPVFCVFLFLDVFLLLIYPASAEILYHSDSSGCARMCAFCHVIILVN